MSEFNEPSGSEAPNGVSRRTVTKAMAWAVPVIAVSAAVPAYAASQVNITFLGGGCKLPGNSNPTYKGYAFLVSVSNSSSVPVEIKITNFTLDGNSLGSTALVGLPPSLVGVGVVRSNPFILPPNLSVPAAALVTSGAPNSQNGVLSITYQVAGAAPITKTVTVGDAPPINGSSCGTFSTDQKNVLNTALGTTPPAWAPNHRYFLGDTVALGGGFVTAVSFTGPDAPEEGDSGGSAPGLPAPGVTVVDNEVTWQRPST